MVAITPAEQPIGGCGLSSGCLLVYDSVENLRADHPGCDYAVIEEKPTPEKK